MTFPTDERDVMRIASSLFRTVGIAIMSTAVVLTAVPANAATPTHATTAAAAAARTIATRSVTVAPRISRLAARPDLSVGGSGPANFYIYFNQTDQSALIAGGVAGVAAVICAVGGPVVCVIAAVAAAAAVVYLNAYGRCPHKGNLRAHVVALRLTAIRCV